MGCEPCLLVIACRVIALPMASPQAARPPPRAPSLPLPQMSPGSQRILKERQRAASEAFSPDHTGRSAAGGSDGSPFLQRIKAQLGSSPGGQLACLDWALPGQGGGGLSRCGSCSTTEELRRLHTF